MARKLSLYSYVETGDPMPGDDVEAEGPEYIKKPHHIRPTGFPVHTGYGHNSGVPVTKPRFVATDKWNLSHPMPVNMETQTRASDFYSMQNEYHRDRLGYLVP